MSTPFGARLNPHGYDAPCNSYCWGETHAVLVLGSRWNADGTETTGTSLTTGMTAYYRDLGWQLLRCRRAETTREHVLAMIMAQSPGGAVQIADGKTEETPIGEGPDDLADYEPWLMIVVPLAEEGRDGR